MALSEDWADRTYEFDGALGGSVQLVNHPLKTLGIEGD